MHKVCGGALRFLRQNNSLQLFREKPIIKVLIWKILLYFKGIFLFFEVPSH